LAETIFAHVALRTDFKTVAYVKENMMVRSVIITFRE
jgi:hypothetical protein